MTDEQGTPGSVPQVVVPPPSPPSGHGGKDLSTANVGSGNWKGVGMWAWLFHRISGLVLVFYVFAHIWVISHAQRGAADFNELFKTLESPLFIVLDLALVAAVLYHAFNGVRVLLFDFGVAIKSHKELYYVLMTLAVVSLAVFAYVSFSFIANG